MRSRRSASVALAMTMLIATALWASSASAQVKPLLRTAVSGDDSKEAVIVAGELPPGGTTGRHTHPGVEFHANLTRGFHRKLTRLCESQYSYGFVDRSSVSSVLLV